MDILWDNPNALFGLWLLLPAGFLLVYAQKKRVGAAKKFADPAMVARLMPVLVSGRPWLRGTLFLLALACLTVAAARPRWGVYFESVSQRGADVMVLLDVSKSMLSRDVVPSRLDRAKSDILDLVRKIRGERIGLIAFAGKASLACPLTTDHGFFRSVLEEIGPHSAPRGGTMIGDAIREALRAMEDRRDRDQALLLITDGEDHDSYPQEAASLAAERDVRIFSVGLGDPDTGSRIPVEDEFGNVTFVKHEGQEVWSRMDERLLQTMALETGGAYVPARTTVYDLGDVYESKLSQLQGGEISAQKRKRYRERFQIFVGLAVLFFIMELLVSPFPRRAVAAVAMIAVLMLPSMAEASDAAKLVREGIDHFKAGALEEAAAKFRDADVALPENPIIGFGRGVVLHAQGDADGASELYAAAAAHRDPEVAIRGRYNAGTLESDRARAVFGETPEEASPEQREEGIGHIQRAILHFRSCLELDPNHEAARKNLEILRLWLKHMTDMWKEKDKEEQREELDLAQFLEMLLKMERGLRATTRALGDVPDTPQSREAVRQTAEAQKDLAREIDPLKGKIEEMFEQAAAGGPPGGAGAPHGAPPQPPDPAQAEKLAQAKEAFLGIAEEAGKTMMIAADEIESNDFATAVQSQKKVQDGLAQIWDSVVPFEKTLQRAIELQKGVVDSTIPWAENEHDEELELPDMSWWAEDEQRVGDLSLGLEAKASQGLEQFSAMPSPSQEELDAMSEEERAAHEEQAKSMEGVKTAYEKAIEHSPRIGELVAEAKGALEAQEPKSALTPAEEALKLLEEIAETLPKEDQNQDGEQNQEGDENQDQEQEQNQDPNQNQDQNSESQSQQQQQPMNRQEAENMLRKAAERERDAKDRRKKANQRAYVPVRVDRDW